jgi:AraC-like DNA-binding protein
MQFIEEDYHISAIFLIHSFPLFYLLGPSFYLYIRGEIKNDLSLKKRDLFQLVPFVLVLIQIIPYSIKPWTYKLQLAQFVHVLDRDGVQSMDLPWISLKFYFISRIILFLGYIGYSFFYFKKAIKSGKLKNRETIKWINWLMLVTILTNILFGIFTFLGFIFTNSLIWSTIGAFLSSGTGVLLFLSTFLFPRVLYGTVKKASTPAGENYKPELNQLQEFELQLKDYLSQTNYLDESFTKSKLLVDLGISDRFFTHYFNEHLGINFNQWKSNLRIDFSLKLIHEGFLKNQTVESLANHVGFQSRSKFSEAFKNRVGESPFERHKSNLSL